MPSPSSVAGHSAGVALFVPFGGGYGAYQNAEDKHHQDGGKGADDVAGKCEQGATSRRLEPVTDSRRLTLCSEEGNT